MNKKTGFIIGMCLVGFALVLVASDATLSTTRPQTEDNQMQVDKRNAKSTSGLYEALQGKGTNIIQVSIGGSTGSAILVTNPTYADITTLLALFQKYHETNGTSSATNSIKVSPLNYDPTTGAAKTTETTPMLSQSYGGDGTWELLSAVSTNTIGEWFTVHAWNSFSFVITTPATVTTNEEVFIDVSLNSGTNWVPVYTNTLATTNNALYQLNGKFQNIRARANTTGTVISVWGKAGYSN